MVLTGRADFVVRRIPEGIGIVVQKFGNVVGPALLAAVLPEPEHVPHSHIPVLILFHAVDQIDRAAVIVRRADKIDGILRGEDGGLQPPVRIKLVIVQRFLLCAAAAFGTASEPESRNHAKAQQQTDDLYEFSHLNLLSL